ncbi:MAG TPA: solute carrier family 23 protein [Desulfovibrio sp.]|jgi:Xanthine/uracil permeases|uniref:uracil-xanthine permease family protein n=1 Tax=Desulfovibrio TaxID=872 RepID=UPI002A3A1A18|nr:solute carrier family 23 protein [Desulfovibrio sp.]MDY0306340.1 solute carrier family 23 protein [Desulfovibrionaceae bacterium]HMM38525.1 solute carrier family 23 protein [Desulfovibrio sp.]
MIRDTLKFDVGQTPPPHTTLCIAFMHVLLVFDAIIFIPNVLGKTTDIAPQTLAFITFAIIIVAAVFTFLQSRTRLGLGAGFVLFTGSYSAFLLCSLDAVKMGGMPLLATMSLLTAPVVFLYTFFIRFFRHIITPAVGGVVILLIATSMVPIGLGLWAGETASVTRLGIGAVTVLILTLMMLFAPPALRLWGPLLAMGGGYGAAALTGELHFEHAVHAAWFGLPQLSAWPGLELDLHSAHLPLFLAFGMGMVASMIESTGNIMLVQQISTRDFRRVSYDRVQGGLYCDGLSKITAALLGTAVPSLYCDNLPLIEMTGVASRRVGAVGAAILLLLAFMPKVSGVILDMPGPVIGGFLIVIAALLFHAGFGLVAMTRLNNQHGLILGLSLVVGLVAGGRSFFPGVAPSTLSPLLQNSVAMGGFTAFLLSTLAYLAPRRGLTGVFRADPAEVRSLHDLLASGRHRLHLPQDRFNVLSLCCEEVFLHMLGQGGRGGEDSVSLRVSRIEEGWSVEMICGHMMDDINNFALPESLLQASPDELGQLGLALFSQYARDVKHMEISGYSYISFLI